jgi:hypothetical protein
MNSSAGNLPTMLDDQTSDMQLRTEDILQQKLPDAATSWRTTEF